MKPSSSEPVTACHVVTMPFPGRSHINSMMSLCKLLSSKKPDILITFTVTEEWLGYIGSEPKPTNLRFAAMPNVLPSEQLKIADLAGFFEAVTTDMEEPFEQLVDRLEPPITAIIADVEVLWGVRVGKRRNIPVALLWTMSLSFFSTLHHFNLFAEDKNLLLQILAGEQEENIPGLSPSQLVDVKAAFHGHYEKAVRISLACSSEATKAQYLLFPSVHELEPEATRTLRTQFSFPVYPFGPAIPYLELSRQHSNNVEKNYFEWLNAQPKGSVLYISFGSFLSVSGAQMDEIAAGLCDSGVRFLWVARSEASRLCDISNGDMGLVISWCDQLMVLCHPSIGGFWTHCGWSSTMEAVFGGVPMLTLPLFLDQMANCRKIVEEWKIGLKVERELGNENLIGREQVSEIVKRFMNNVSEEGKEMRKRCKDLGGVCHQAVAKGGSSDINLNCFIRDICGTPGQN